MSNKNNELKTLYGADKNVFIYGLTGSGKDTFLNIIKDKKYDYVYMRLADTLKHIITEARLESFNELEVSKRGSDDIRKMHNNIDETLRQFYTHPSDSEQENIGYNRAKMIIERKSFDFTNPHIIDKDYLNKLHNYPILISDVREEKIIKMLLDSGWYGIFIDRVFKHTEYNNPEQKTEFNVFDNTNKSRDFLDEILPKYKEQVKFIHVDNKEFGSFINNKESYYYTILSDFEQPYMEREKLYKRIKKDFKKIIKYIRLINQNK